MSAPAHDSSVMTSRRQLLRTTAAGLAAAGLVNGFPAILRAADKAGKKPVLLGSAAHSYQWVEGWAKLPDGKKFGNCHAVCEVEDGRIFVHNMSPTGDATCIFDPDGKFISSWGTQFARGAHGMDYRKEGNTEFLYLAPTNMHKVFKTTLDGEVVMELDYPKVAKNDKGELCYQDGSAKAKKTDKTVEKKAEEFYVPTFIALAPNGDFYVTDGYGAGYIHRYNLKGEYVSTFGGKGDADDKTACPHGIYCDTRNPARPMLVVADREHNRLQYFTLEGKLDHLVTNEKPEQGKDDSGMLRRPCHFHQLGTDLLIPDLRGRVTILDKDNKAVAQLGDNEDPAKRANNRVPESETKPGQFCTPHGATFDRKGNIYVAEWLAFGRVTKLKKVDA